MKVHLKTAPMPATEPAGETPGQRYDRYKAQVTAAREAIGHCRDELLGMLIAARRMSYEQPFGARLNSDTCDEIESRCVSALVELADVENGITTIAMGAGAVAP